MPPPTLADVRHDRAVRRRGRIDRDRVDAALGRRVVEAAAAARHPQRARAERGEGRAGDRLRGARGGRGLGAGDGCAVGSAGSDRAGRGLRLGIRSVRARHACILRRGATHPVGVEVAGRVRKPVAPVGLGRAEILFVAAGARHELRQRGLLGGQRRRVRRLAVQLGDGDRNQRRRDQGHDRDDPLPTHVLPPLGPPSRAVPRAISAAIPTASRAA